MITSPCGPIGRSTGRDQAMTRPMRVVRRHETCPPATPLRGLLPPLTVAVALTTAIALLLLSLTLAPPRTSALATPASFPLTVAPPPTAPMTRLALAANIPLPPEPVVLALARLIYPPGSGGSSRILPGTLLLVVEAGSLTANLTGPAEIVRADGLPTMAATRLILQPGDRLLAPTSTPVAFRNEGATPALVLAAGVFPARIVSMPAPPQRLIASATPFRWDAYWTPGATIQSLAAGSITDPPPGGVTLELRRLDLAPGAQAPLLARDGMAIGVETGALTLTLARGLAWVETPDGPDALLGNAGVATLLPGDGALIQNQAAGMLRNDGGGPLLILVLTVSPAMTGATPRAAA